jgi:hypothetical protein
VMPERISFGGVGVQGFALGTTEDCAVSEAGTLALGAGSALAAGAVGAWLGSLASKKHGALAGAIVGGALGSTAVSIGMDKVQHPDCGHSTQKEATTGGLVAGSVLTTALLGSVGAAAGRGISKKRTGRAMMIGALSGVTLAGASAAAMGSIFCWSCDQSRTP